MQAHIVNTKSTVPILLVGNVYIVILSPGLNFFPSFLTFMRQKTQLPMLLRNQRGQTRKKDLQLRKEKKNTSIIQKRLQTSAIIPEIKEMLQLSLVRRLCVSERSGSHFGWPLKTNPSTTVWACGPGKKHRHKTSNSTLTFLTRLRAVIGNRGCKPQNKKNWHSIKTRQIEAFSWDSSQRVCSYTKEESDLSLPLSLSLGLSKNDCCHSDKKVSHVLKCITLYLVRIKCPHKDGTNIWTLSGVSPSS